MELTLLPSQNFAQPACVLLIIIIIIIMLGSTALYGPGPPLVEVTKTCAFMAAGDRPASRA
jgi:hypothetical protein